MCFVARGARLTVNAWLADENESRERPRPPPHATSGLRDCLQASTFTTDFPKLRPSSIRMNAGMVCSKPSVTSSR